MEGRNKSENEGNSPLLIYTISYLSGIVSGSRIFVSVDATSILCYILFSLSISLFYFSFYVKRSVLSEKFLPCLFCIVMYICGWINVQHSESLLRSKEDSLLIGRGYIKADCILEGKPIRKNASYRADVIVLQTDEKSILYLDKKFPAEKADAGDTLSVVFKPSAIKNFSVDFDYAGYLEKDGIFTSSFVRSDKIVFRKCKNPSLKYKFKRLKSKYICLVQRTSEDSSQSAIRIAITTGDKRYLENSVRGAFSKSGTMHILAVSGLHTGILFSFVTFILIPLGGNRFSNITRYIIQIIFLWGYASFTGFSPSVFRASLMLTVHLTAKMAGRGNWLFHSLTLSALIICIINPYSIFELGFQLSYTALLSIIFIHPTINLLYKPTLKFSKYIWGVISMSIACQIGTSLIIITTFGYFPVYFLLANLIAIPLTSIILLLSSVVPFLGGCPGSITESFLSGSIRLLEFCVTRIESLPFSSVRVILNETQVNLLILLVISLYLKIPYEKSLRIPFCIGIFILLIINSL